MNRTKNSHWCCRLPVAATLLLAVLGAPGNVPCIAQGEVAQGDVVFPPVADADIRRLDAVRIDQPITIDGKLDEPAWAEAVKSPSFVDLITGKKTMLETRVRLMWDDEYLYVGYDVEEPNIQAKFTERDSLIYQENDVELFVAGEDAYYEFEINALGTIYEGLFVWQSAYESSGIAKLPEVDRSRPEVKSQKFTGVGFQSHPRGPRWAFLGWDFPKAKTAVHVNGTLNDSSDKDVGWTVELAFPWKEFALLDLSKPRSLPPKSGDVWRIDFSRFNQYKEPEPAEDSGGWALSHHGVWDSHIPECFPYVCFVDRSNGGRVKRGRAQDAIPPNVSPNVSQWDSSRLEGFPDPPPPLKLVPAFPTLEIPRLLALNRVPDTNCLLAVDHQSEWGGPGRIYQFSETDDPTFQSLDLFLERPEIIYGLAFHPNFESNRWVYVGCNGRSDALEAVATRVLRFRVDGDGPFRCDPESMTVVIEWKSNGHNGGDLAFGNDGLLYVSTGDGTSDSDIDRNGQNLATLNGGVLRIDVDVSADDHSYDIPVDNPFVNIDGARGELWAYGLRNPWRLTFDAQSGQLWVGNNGQDLWESVYLVDRGANYGWSIRESNHPFHVDQDPGPVAISLATVEHDHSEARSLTGGHVYRGTQYPWLRGAYVYGDYSTGNVWAVRHDGKQVVWQQHLARSTAQITGFGVDSRGEFLIADHAGTIHRLASNDVSQSMSFPTRLSETGLFADAQAEQVLGGVREYFVNSPLWSDGAVKRRWMAVPEGSTIGYRPRGAWEFPSGSVLVKSFALPCGDEGRLRRVETRVMTRQAGEWFGYSYRWNEAQDDATLVEGGGMDEMLDWVTESGERTEVRWRYPSRSECMVCHSRAAGFVLGLSTEQLNRTLPCLEADAGSNAVSQLDDLKASGLLADAATLPDFHGTDVLPDPTDESAALEDRVRSYLHVNCASCHVNAGGGNSRIVLDYFTELKDMVLVGSPPQHTTLGIDHAKLIDPGHPERSVLLARMSRRGEGQMPPLATNRVDDKAVALIKQWILSLEAETQVDQ